MLISMIISGMVSRLATILLSHIWLMLFQIYFCELGYVRTPDSPNNNTDNSDVITDNITDDPSAGQGGFN